MIDLHPAVWEWTRRTLLAAGAAVVAVLAKRLWVILRRNAVLRHQLDGPPGSFLLGERA